MDEPFHGLSLAFPTSDDWSRRMRAETPEGLPLSGVHVARWLLWHAKQVDSCIDRAQFRVAVDALTRFQDIHDKHPDAPPVHQLERVRARVHELVQAKNAELRSDDLSLLLAETVEKEMLATHEPSALSRPLRTKGRASRD